MKKHLSVIAALLVSSGLFAAQEDTLLAFSTPGPDFYSDGFRVLDGESYAVVWTADGAEFGGLTSEGKVVKDTDKVVLVAPLAKNARCPLTVLEIAAGRMPEYDGGSFALYLLDTRVRTADGKTALAPRKDGAPETVNAVGEAATDDGEGRLAAAGRVKLGTVGVYTEIEAPSITAIKIENATVTLKVKGMSKAASYFVVPSETIGTSSPALDVKPVDDTFTFPQPADAQFFKILGVRNY